MSSKACIKGKMLQPGFPGFTPELLSAGKNCPDEPIRRTFQAGITEILQEPAGKGFCEDAIQIPGSPAQEDGDTGEQILAALDRRNGLHRKGEPAKG